MLTFRFFDADGMMTVYEKLTTGMVGKQAKLEFSAEWANRRKTAVFTSGSVTKDVLNVTDIVTIPHEVLQNPGDKLYVGIYGVSEDGTQITPTIYAQGPKIFEGADPSGDESTDVTLPVWAQLDSRVSYLEQNGTGGSSGSDSTQNGIYILSDGETLEDVPDDADLVIDPNGEADEETVTGDYIPVPTTAEVGQTIVVKEVDESGKPTAWEAVDMAGGADDKWELIAEATIDEWVSIITIDKDSEGNTFSLKKMVVALTLPVCTLEDGTTTSTGYTHYQVNKQGTWQGPSANWENAKFWFEIELVGNWFTVRCYKTSASNGSNLWSACNHTLSEAVDSNALTSFTYKNFNTNCGYDGCSYKVYGVRA